MDAQQLAQYYTNAMAALGFGLGSIFWAIFFWILGDRK